MGIRTRIKKLLTFGFQPKTWLGYEQVKSNGKVCLDLANDILLNKENPKKAENKQRAKYAESQMTSEQRQSRKKLALILSVSYFVFSLCLIGYGVYLIVFKSLYLSSCVSFVVSALVFSYVLRELMVLGQIHTNKKRISFRELLRLIFKLKDK